MWLSLLHNVLIQLPVDTYNSRPTVMNLRTDCIHFTDDNMLSSFAKSVTLLVKILNV